MRARGTVLASVGDRLSITLLGGLMNADQFARIRPIRVAAGPSRLDGRDLGRCCKPGARLGAHRPCRAGGACRHRRRRRPDGALHPGNGQEAQPDGAAAQRGQQVGQLGRRGPARRQGRAGQPAQAGHHAVQPVHHADGHRHQVHLAGHHAGADAGARPVRVVGQRQVAVPLAQGRARGDARARRRAASSWAAPAASRKTS